MENLPGAFVPFVLNLRVPILKLILPVEWGLAAAHLLAAGLCLGADSPLTPGEQPRTNSLPDVRPLSLPEALRIALSRNPEIRAADARTAAAAGRAYQAGLWANPEMEFTLEEWPVGQGRGISDAKETAGIAQVLPFPGKKALERRVGGAGVKLSKAEAALRRTLLARDTKAGFFRVLAAEQLLDTARQLVNVSQSSADVARRRTEAGAIPYQEQLRAELQLEQTRTELAEFARERAIARRSLAALLGRPELAETPMSGTLADRALPGLLRETDQRTVAAHPSVRIAQEALERAELERQRARLEPYPDVTAGLAGGYLGESDQSILELRVGVPLPILDRAKGRKMEARANVAAAEAELDAASLQLRGQWDTGRERYRAAAEQVENYRDRILPKAEEALRLVRTGFEEGKFTFIDLLDTQRTTAETRLAYQQKLLELNLAQAELEAVLQPESTPQ